MAWVLEALARFLELTWPKALLPRAARREFVKVPARVVIQHDVPARTRLTLVDRTKASQKRHVGVVLIVDLGRLRKGLIDHLGELLRTGAVDLGEIGVLGALAIEPGGRRGQGMKVAVRVLDVALYPLRRLRQVMLTGVVQDKAK